MSWDLLKRFIESEVFNQNPFWSVAYLSWVFAVPAFLKFVRLTRIRRYSNNVGIHYILCQKLRQFSYEEIEFFLPQLCHLIISVDNESMALEEFILDLCEESVNAALLVGSVTVRRKDWIANEGVDILAFSDISTRLIRQPAIRSFQDM